MFRPVLGRANENASKMEESDEESDEESNEDSEEDSQEHDEPLEPRILCDPPQGCCPQTDLIVVVCSRHKGCKSEA